VNTATPQADTRTERRYSFGAFTLDMERGFLLRDGDPVDLRPKAFDVLAHLVLRHGVLVRKDDLVAAVWRDVAVTDNSLVQCIADIRRALGDTDQTIIRTVARRGYVFSASLAPPAVRLVADASSLAGARAEGYSAWRTVGSEPHALPPPRETPSSRTPWVIAAFLTVLTLVAAAGVTWSRRADSLRTVPGAGMAVIPARTIAVLPFQPLNQTDRDDVFGVGMADSLIDRLSLIDGLGVRPLAAVRFYADGTKDPVTAGRELQVTSVLDGSLQREGDRILVNTRLRDVSSGRVLWAGQFDEPYRDVFAMQDSISGKVADALSMRLPSGVTRPVASAAWENYARGHYFLEQYTPEGNLKAIEYFERAIQAQPDFALAHAWLATNYGIMLERTFMPPAEALPKLRQEAERAMALDASLAESHFAIAQLHMHELAWAEAERSYRRAIELNPNFLDAYSFYSYMLMMLDRNPEAFELRRHALALDPVSDYASKDMAEGLLVAGRPGEALDMMKVALKLRPDWPPALEVQASAYFALNRLDEARRVFEAAGARVAVAYIDAQRGNHAPAVALIDEMRHDWRTGVGVAELQLSLGDRSGALTSLEDAVEKRAGGFKFIKVNPLLAPLRDEPRFKQLLKRLNLEKRAQ
jgi:DNA-binding winged helix-turn-helix (wHTH) protein/TolB-like protein